MVPFYSYLRLILGRTATSSYQRLAKMFLKRVKILARKEFLLNCRRIGVFPAHISNGFLNINNTLSRFASYANRTDALLNDFKKRSLNLEIQQVHWEIKQLDREIDALEANLAEMNTEVLNDFVKKQRKFMNKKLKKIMSEQDRKIEKLKALNVVACGGPHNEDWLVNKTDKEIPIDVAYFLSFGPKMGLPLDGKRDIPLPQIIAEVESVIRCMVLSTEGKNRVRSDVTNNIKNFLHKNTKVSPHDKRLKDCKQATVDFLKNNPDIIVTRADKGNKTVVMAKDEYFCKMNALVNDRETYELLKKDFTTYYQTKNNELIHKLFSGGYIDEKTKNWLITYKALPPLIYGLPKIHKPEMPLRPIVSSIGAPTHTLSKFCSNILKNVTTNSQFNVKNSFEFVDKISQQVIDDDEVMASFDVVSLFTNIPRDLVIEAIEREWDTISDFTTIPLSMFKELIVLIMRSGYFKYQGKYYSQLEGMPMGGCMSPVVADLVMESVLVSALAKLPHPPKLVTKYVDDLFLIVKEREVENTLEVFNSIHNKIKFTCEREVNGCLPYLDTLVERHNDGSLTTCWYKKPIASGRLLNYHSAHPMSQKLNTAQGFIHRVKKLTTSSSFDTKKVIFDSLRQNGYTNQLIAKLMSQSERRECMGNVLVSNEESQVKRYFSLSYVPELSERIRKTICKASREIVLCMKTNNTAERLYTKLKDKMPLVDRTNVIYSIPCDCGLSYIGRTSRKLGQRLKEHSASLRDFSKEASSLVKHCRDLDDEMIDHRFNFDDAKVLCQTRNPHHLNVMEMFFIRKLQGEIVNDRQEGILLSNCYSPVIWQRANREE